MMSARSGAEKLAAVHVKAQWGTRALQLPGWGAALGALCAAFCALWVLLGCMR